MPFLRRRLSGVLASGALVAAFMVGGAVGVQASGTDLTCTGGTPVSPTTIPGGAYHSITVAGVCAIDGGNVTVQRNVTVLSGGALLGIYAGSALTVGRDLLVNSGANAYLGCDPAEDINCVGNTAATVHHTVWGNFVASGGILVVLHDAYVYGSVSQDGGGGGGSCAALFETGPPAYVDYAQNWIGGNANVNDLKTCWDGFNLNTVGGLVNHNDNETTIPDGNLVNGNNVAGSLSCFEDSPASHLSDFAPIPNDAEGLIRGECVAISTN